MAVRVAINGMGVIGREVFRQLCGNDDYRVVLINDIIDPDNLAYLLKYDSVYHDWAGGSHSITTTENSIVVDGREILLYKESDVCNLPLGENHIDVAIDCSGLLNSREKLEGFICAGAARVISCDYCENDIYSIAYNVNHEILTPNDTIVSCPPMESQVAAEIFNALKGYVIQGAMVKAYRPFTNAQTPLDSYNSKQFASGRSASGNISPISDGMSKCIGVIVPELNGKVLGLAYRSPITNGSILDFTIQIQGSSSIKEINSMLKAASSDSLGYSDDMLCSSDALGFDAPQILSTATMANYSGGSTLVSITVVYDNIRGHSKAVAKVAKYMAEL